jgi:O-antigen ligase|tara:strand:- start:673 stop:1941 length:1269 start_codon:yes stop_codon:yes gene_type:complete
MNEVYFNRYLLILLSILPFSFLIGPSISLINILVFDIFIILFFFLKKEWSWTNEITIKIFLLLYLYLIFNSLISINPMVGFQRNFGFIRLIVLFIGINYFFNKYKYSDKIFRFWSLIILLIVMDIFIELIFGSNIFGYGANEDRVASFFDDELIVGGFVLSFFFITVGFYLNKLNNFNNLVKIILLIFLILFFISIIFTGERSNSIKAILGLVILIFSYFKFNLKSLSVLIILFFIIIFTVNKNNYLKNRFVTSIIHSGNTFVSSFQHGTPHDNPSGNLYAKLYRSGYDVFKNYPYFGVGNKNYRVEACTNKFYHRGIHITINNYVCMTHPHQIYFELLSEHGILGSLLILAVFSFLLLKGFKANIEEKNFIGIGCFCYLFTVFTPLIPSGSFFSDYNISLFFINLSIMYASSKQLNIFNKR